MCSQHSDTDAWTNVNQVAKLTNFTDEHVNRALDILRDPKLAFDRNASSGK